MLDISKYQISQEDLSISQEGFLGGLAGFLGSAAVGMAVPFIGSAAAGAGLEASVQKKKKEIKIICDRIAKIRNGQIDEVKKKGIKLPKNIDYIDSGEVVKGAVYGFLFGAIYGAYKGSELQNENDKLQEKLKELEEEYRRAGVPITDEEISND